MPNIIAFILFPISFIYGIVLFLRNYFFDIGLFSQYKSSIKVVSVGNLSVGGTGKTPHVEFLIDSFKGTKNIAVVSRGYGRASKGLVKVELDSKSSEVGDESLQLKLKYPELTVIVAERRKDALVFLENYTNVDLCILDDAFQHRYVARDLNILLSEYENPYFKDYVLPSGRLREFRRGYKRSDIIIYTKCKSFKNINKDLYSNKNNIPVHFSKVDYKNLNIENTCENIILVTGIAKPVYLKNELEKRFKFVNHKEFKDHHAYSLKDVEMIHKLFDNLVSENKFIVTTEKDWVKLKDLIPSEYVDKWIVQSVIVRFENDKQIIEEIGKYVD
jgi:tetraacyldisaccharide 4'-kinase